MAILLKIKFNEDVHRLLLEKSALNFEGLREAIRKIYPAMKFTAKYRDEENDLCTLYTTTFDDFLTHAVEQNGKTLLKLELFEIQVESENKAASADVEGCSPQHHAEQNPCAHWMQMGQHMLHRFLQKGHGKGHHGHHIIKQFKTTVMQMHRQGLLNSKSMAALVLGCLPDVMSFIASHPDKIDWKLGKKAQELKPLLEHLQELVASTPGLEQCQATIAKWIQNAMKPCEALSAVLSALQSLPREAQAAFIEAVYTRLESRLQVRLQAVEQKHIWMPNVPMVHEGITCDGCDKGPIIGLRFKSQSRPDYDLCSDCFMSKTSQHSGECAGHEFKMISTPGHFNPWSWMCKGKWKGKGHGKGKCKGKGKGKGKFASEDIFSEYSAPLFQVHSSDAMLNSFETADHTAPADAGAQQFDMVFPVEVEDGRRLTIAWNKSDNPQDVACTFAQTHHIAPDELATIEAFVLQSHLAAQMEEAEIQQLLSEQDGSPQVLESDAHAVMEVDAKADNARPCETENTLALPEKHADATPVQRPCAREGCGYAATWHPTHCCAACAVKGGHGGRCERQLLDSKPSSEKVVVSNEASVGMGLDQKDKVAEQVEAVAKMEQDVDHDLKLNAQHLEEMGLGSADALFELLKSNGGSVQSVLESLLSGDMA